MRFLALIAILLLASTAHAGVYYSGEAFRPLPAQWRGYLPDQRLLRALGNPNSPITPPMREGYVEVILQLETKAKTQALTADEAADLGALHLRLGAPAKALAVLRPAARTHPEHFRLAANLGTAWHLTGDLPQAILALEEAVRLAPLEARGIESLHLKLVQGRAKDPKSVELDNLFDVKFTGEPGKLLKLPPFAVVYTQGLALALPNDGRLLWQLGELANASGDIRTAANILDGCVGEFSLSSPTVRQHREAYRAAVDALEKDDKHTETKTTIVFRSPRALQRAIDPARLPRLKPGVINELPWVAISETEIGPKGRAQFLKYVEDLDGQEVKLIGYVLPGGGGKGGELTSFLFTENPIGCWFCESPGPTQTVVVDLAPGLATEVSRTPIKLTGKLKLNRTDPESYPFTLTGAKLGVVD
jgi:hypothetical protein